MKAKAFKLVKQHIWDGTSSEVDYSEFICITLVMLAAQDFISKRTAQQCAKIVRDRVGSTLEEWLVKQGVPYTEFTPRRLQAHRKAWLDMLIKEFS